MSVVVLVGVRPFPLDELHFLCAGLVSPRSCPPRASGVRWSSVNAISCDGGSCMLMGCPHSQQTACSGCRSSLRRSRRTLSYHFLGRDVVVIVCSFCLTLARLYVKLCVFK